MDKITRSSYLYLEPKTHKKDHAQCSSCMMWTGEKANTCTIHGSKEKVTGDMSCGFYVEGDPMPEMAGEEHASVTSDESGLYKGDVRCENCDAFEDGESECELFEKLNEKMPEHFELDTNVQPKACCNAFHPSKPSVKRLRDKADTIAG